MLKCEEPTPPRPLHDPSTVFLVMVGSYGNALLIPAFSPRRRRIVRRLFGIRATTLKSGLGLRLGAVCLLIHS